MKSMPKVTLNQLRERAERVEQRRREYRERAVAGTLVRHETWRLDYLSRPYLLGAPDERVAERFRNVFVNAMELSPKGQLTPVPMTRTDEYMQVFRCSTRRRDEPDLLYPHMARASGRTDWHGFPGAPHRVRE